MSCPTHPSQRLRKHSSCNKEGVLLSRECGCFYCMRLFPASAVRKWTDQGQTALCPLCGMDTVLPEALLDRPLTVELLEGLGSEQFLVKLPSQQNLDVKHLVSGQTEQASRVASFPDCLLRHLGRHDPRTRPQDRLFSHILLSPRQLFIRVLLRVSLAPVWAMMGVALGFFALDGSDLAFGLGLPTVSSPMVWVFATAAGFVATGWKLPIYWRATRAWNAIRREDWANPCLARAAGFSDFVDLRLARTSDALFRDAKDWARATQSHELKKTWAHWMRDAEHLRNENLRQFIHAARTHAGPMGPYEPGDPL